MSQEKTVHEQEHQHQEKEELHTQKFTNTKKMKNFMNRKLTNTRKKKTIKLTLKFNQEPRRRVP
jgi:hypothetical protein